MTGREATTEDREDVCNCMAGGLPVEKHSPRCPAGREASTSTGGEVSGSRHLDDRPLSCIPPEEMTEEQFAEEWKFWTTYDPKEQT